MGEVVSRESEVYVAFMPPDVLAEQWPSIERELDNVKHIWSDQWTKEMLFAALDAQAMQLWVAGKEDSYSLVVFTQLAPKPVGLVLEVVLAFGNNFFSALPMLEATLERFAQMQDCVRIDVMGREGFERVLKAYGFRKSCVVVSRDVRKRELH